MNFYLFFDLLMLTTAPEILLRMILNPESLESGDMSKYAKWIYNKIGVTNDVKKN